MRAVRRPGACEVLKRSGCQGWTAAYNGSQRLGPTLVALTIPTELQARRSELLSWRHWLTRLRPLC